MCRRQHIQRSREIPHVSLRIQQVCLLLLGVFSMVPDVLSSGATNEHHTAAQKIADEPVHVNVDFSQAPELAAWAHKARELVIDWHPKIKTMILNPGMPAPQSVNLVFKDMEGIANRTRQGITFSSRWIKAHPKDYGLVVHELVHVVQDYPPGSTGWLVEGIADYIRYVHYEPERKKLPKPSTKNSYKQGYGMAAGFLFWLEQTHAPHIVRNLSVALRQGSYHDDMFQTWTGQSLETLWNAYVER